MENSNENTQGNAMSNEEFWQKAGFSKEQIDVLRQDAEAKVVAQKQEAQKQLMEKEYSDQLEILLKDPLLAGKQEEFSKFARESELRNFGRQGLIETMKLFNKQQELAANKKPEAEATTGAAVDNPGETARGTGRVTNANGLPLMENSSNVIDFTGIDLEKVDPRARREVERLQRIQRERRARAAGYNFGQ